MTNLKSILLGTGAAIVAATSAQAADLPVVEPVDYVQICDLYGDGFWYIPGTSTCLEISGFARFEARFSSDEFAGTFIGEPGALFTPSPLRTVVTAPVGTTTAGTVTVLDGDGDTFGFGARGRVNFDARTETDLGTLRSFIQFDAGTAFGVSSIDDVDIDLAFIQFDIGPATMTAGLAASISGVSGPDTLGDATAFESGIGENVQLALAFNFGPVSAAIAVSDPNATFGANAFDGFGATAAGIATTTVGAGQTALGFAGSALYSGQSTIGNDLPYLEAAIDFDLGPVSIDTGFIVGQVESRVRAIDSVTGVVLTRDFDEVGYGAAISGEVDVAALRVKAGASYANGIADFGADFIGADYRVGTPFGVAASTTTAAALAALDFDLVEAYSFYGQIGADVGIFAVNLIGTYGHIEYPTFQGAGRTVTGGSEAEAYTVALNASVAPVEGLRISGEVYYTDVQADANVARSLTTPINAAFLNGTAAAVDRDYDNDAFGAIFRIERSF